MRDNQLHRLSLTQLLQQHGGCRCVICVNTLSSKHTRHRDDLVYISCMAIVASFESHIDVCACVTVAGFAWMSGRCK